jgi:hypothetical protein
VGAGKYFHQSTFTGAVFTDEGQHFTAPHLQIDAAQCQGGPKTFADTLHPQ